jgi:hypothetical protein
MWKKETTYIVLALVVGLLFFISKEADAETIAEYSPLVAVGGSLQDDQGALMLHERFKGKYSVGVILLKDTKDRSRSNKGVEFLRVSEYKKFELGLGFTAWSRESAAWSAKQTFALLAGYNITNKCAVRIRHWSTGGTSSNNKGLDMATFGCQFGAK